MPVAYFCPGFLSQQQCGLPVFCFCWSSELDFVVWYPLMICVSKHTVAGHVFLLPLSPIWFVHLLPLFPAYFVTLVCIMKMFRLAVCSTEICFVGCISLRVDIRCQLMWCCHSSGNSSLVRLTGLTFPCCPAIVLTFNPFISVKQLGLRLNMCFVQSQVVVHIGLLPVQCSPLIGKWLY